jgi:hypothetical protein
MEDDLRGYLEIGELIRETVGRAHLRLPALRPRRPRPCTFLESRITSSSARFPAEAIPASVPYICDMTDGKVYIMNFLAELRGSFSTKACKSVSTTKNRPSRFASGCSTASRIAFTSPVL